MIRYEPVQPKYYEGMHSIEDGFDANMPVISSLKDHLFTDSENNNTDFFIGTSRRRVAIRFESSFFHSFFHTLGPILYEYKKDPNVEIILLQASKEKNAFSSSGNFITKLLRDLQITHYVTQIHSKYPPVLENFYYYNSVELCGVFIECLRNVIDNYRDYNKENNKKIYITRKGKQNMSVTQANQMSDEEKKQLPFTDDLRIDNELELENFLKNKGFEIIDGDMFTDMEDQISFFDQAKIIVSLSGSGLTNSLFMRDNTTVMELSTTQLLRKKIEFHYHFYLIATLFTNKTYISISNIARRYDKIKDELDRILKIYEY